MTGDAELATSAVSALAEVPAADWNALVAGRSFYLGWDWLRAQDRGQRVGARYLLVHRAGRLAGALPTYLVEHETNDFYRPDRCVDGRWRGRYLLAGARRGYANDLLVHPDLAGSEAAAVGRVLLAGLAARAAAESVDGALFLYLDSAGAERLRPLVPGGVPLLSAADAVIDLPGSGFADYLDALPRKRRWKIRHEIGVFGQAGLTLGVEPAGDCWAALAPLFGQVQRRYGHQADDDYCRRLLERQAAALAPQAVVLTLRDGGRLVGGVLAYPWADTLYQRLVGLDYGRLGGRFEYFNLFFYHAARFGYERGLSRLHLGREAVQAKVNRGGRLRPLWSLKVPADPADGSAERWNRDEARRLRAQVSVPAAFADPGWARWGAGGRVTPGAAPGP
ncbi:MAG: GNAT family N-acetyltransferase [Mycobacteriales bacterium]